MASNSQILTASAMSSANTMLIYGASGTYKTTQLGFAAEWINKTFTTREGKPKRCRLLTVEGYNTIAPHVSAGMIEVINLLQFKSVLMAVRKFGRGQKLMENAQGKLEWVDFTKQPDHEEIGCYMLEGLTSIGDRLMSELRERQQKIGQDAVTPFEIEGEKFSGNSQGHYGFVQQELYDLIKRLGSIPCERQIITAHESKGEESDSKKTIRGPALVGEKKTDKVPAWVGECLHAEQFHETVKRKHKEDGKEIEVALIETKTRIYFEPHPDPDFPNIKYPAKPRVPARMIPKLKAKYPLGYFVPGIDKGLDDYLETDYRLGLELAEMLKSGTPSK